MKEYLAELDDAANGGATPVDPKFVAPTDPAARWTAENGGPAFYRCADNHLNDLKHAVIMDVEVTIAVRQAEVGAAKTMITQTADRFEIKPEHLATDTAYGCARTLAWLVDEQNIEPHILVFDKSGSKDGTFSRYDFSYDQATDVCVCPASKTLTTTGLVNDEATLVYRASKHDCDVCELKSRCCPNSPARKVPRSIHEAARDRARAIAKTDAYVTSRRERKKVEMLFAHLKRILKLDRLRLRGPCGARDEFLLAATVQNLLKMAKSISVMQLLPAF